MQGLEAEAVLQLIPALEETHHSAEMFDLLQETYEPMTHRTGPVMQVAHRHGVACGGVT